MDDEQRFRRMLYRAMLLLFSGLLLIIMAGAAELLFTNI